VPATADQVANTAAVSGAWLTFTQDSSCAATIPAVTHGYLMGFCAENDKSGSTPSTYSMFACTQDESTGTVVLYTTEFSDSKCRTGASPQTPISFSTTCSNDGVNVQCPVTSTYLSVVSKYSIGGLVVSSYPSSAECNEGLPSDIVFYGGLKGCDSGNLYDLDSRSRYLPSDLTCSGAVVEIQAYFDIDQGMACMLEDDDDNDDVMAYDELYSAFAWNKDDEDDDICFHVDTKIDYKGVEYTFEELKAGKEPECTVPHTPSSKGVVISTSCDKTVRVTDTHLVATTKGFQLAYSLKAGDVLFGDYGKDMCIVKSVEKEKSTQQYFGLNCVHSEVLASGLRASTFGDFHTLPSWYMTYVGGLVGSEAASSLGEYVAEWWYRTHKLLSV
jgi:hypothetical protein